MAIISENAEPTESRNQIRQGTDVPNEKIEAKSKQVTTA